MGLNNDHVLRGALVFDLESAPIDGAAQYLEEPTAPSNYVKPEAISAYVAKAKAKQLDECALDVDLARIVALGFTNGDGGVSCYPLKDEQDEREALEHFWGRIQPYPYPRLIGWNVIGFDLPMMIRRSLYLGMAAPSIPLGKYKHPDVDDLMLVWSMDGALKFRSLNFVCKRLGIDIPDAMSGADVGKAVVENRWEDVVTHCISDVRRTAAVAEKLGYLKPVAEMAL